MLLVSKAGGAIYRQSLPRRAASLLVAVYKPSITTRLTAEEFLVLSVGLLGCATRAQQCHEQLDVVLVEVHGLLERLGDIIPHVEVVVRV
jgi:hypothetical protein